MIVVTGGAGFIGSNLVHGLNAHGRNNILVVDYLEDSQKFLNIRDAKIADYIDQNAFLDWLVENGDDNVEAVFHLGACSDMSDRGSRHLMSNNYQYSKEALDICLAYKIPFIYASSAAVYGAGPNFSVRVGEERPLNLYGYSKALFDQYAARKLFGAESQILGLRYFNVYGPREGHKGAMASVIYHQCRQMKTDGVLRLFEGRDGYGDGEQMRDFVYVDDTVKVKIWGLEHPEVSGIFNCGTGKAASFNRVAERIMTHFGAGEIEYIPLPMHMRDCYQSYTQADLSGLRAAGYKEAFKDISSGIAAYLW